MAAPAPNDDGRWRWGVPAEEQPNFKRRRTCEFLNEMLVEFPDPDTLNRHNDGRTTNKLDNIIDSLTERHKEQRRRLFERHTAEHDAWKRDVELGIDAGANLFPHACTPDALSEHVMKESWEVLKANGPTALEILPAAYRKVWVSTEQLKHPPGLDPNEPTGVSTVQFAAEIAAHGVAMRQRMLNEEQRLRLFQFESSKIFYQARARSGPRTPANPLIATRRPSVPQKPTTPAPVPTFMNRSGLEPPADPRRPSLASSSAGLPTTLRKMSLADALQKRQQDHDSRPPTDPRPSTDPRRPPQQQPQPTRDPRVPPSAPQSPVKNATPQSPAWDLPTQSPARNIPPRSPAWNMPPQSPAMNPPPQSPARTLSPPSPAWDLPTQSPARNPPTAASGDNNDNNNGDDSNKGDDSAAAHS